jgi:tetratricopeptide (TPR) repeat protein
LCLIIADGLHKAIEFNPELVEAYNNRAGAYLKKGQYDQVIADCNKVVELDINLAMAYFMRGVAYIEQGKMAEAVSDLELCIALSQDLAVIQSANELLNTLR